MNEPRAVQNFINNMLTYTIRLVRVDFDAQPKAIASGFIIPVGNDFRIISAGHAIGASSQWAVETVPVSATETLMLSVSGVQTLVSVSPRCESGAFDIAWADIDCVALSEQLSRAPRLPRAPLELPTYQGPLDSTPDKQVPYGFAAWNRVELHPALSTLVREASYELYMSYIETDPLTGLYCFDLSRSHQGHDYYREPVALQLRILKDESSLCLYVEMKARMYSTGFHWRLTPHFFKHRVRTSESLFTLPGDWVTHSERDSTGRHRVSADY